LTEAAAETIEVSAAVVLRTLCKRLRDADAVLEIVTSMQQITRVQRGS
jgi:hypothetical protein